MGIPTLPEVPMKPTTEQLAQIVAEGFQQLGYLMSGFLSSDNAREFGGWQIGKTEMQSKDKTVGMSTNKVGVDPIRFWAGDVIDGDPNFKVTQEGILTAVAAIFLSAAGYPRIAFNQNSNLLQAFADANNHLDISPISGGSPAISCTAGGTTVADFGSTASLTRLVSLVQMLLQSTGDMTIQSFGEINLAPSSSLRINGSAGQTGTVYVSATPGGPANIPISFSKGIRTS